MIYRIQRRHKHFLFIIINYFLFYNAFRDDFDPFSVYVPRVETGPIANAAYGRLDQVA